MCVMDCPHHQLGWIWNHLGGWWGIALGVSGKRFPDRNCWGGEELSQMWAAPLHGLGVWNKGGKGEVSARFIRCPSVTEGQLSAMCSHHHSILPEHMGPTDWAAHSAPVNKNNKPFLSFKKNDLFLFYKCECFTCMYIGALCSSLEPTEVPRGEKWLTHVLISFKFQKHTPLGFYEGHIK